MLGGIFTENFGIPSESCASYQASSKTGKCHAHKDCEEIVKVKSSYYIGGFYGYASEKDMMREIRSRGPIIGDMEVPLSFTYYKSGIFSDDAEVALQKIKDSAEYSVISDD
mmetsp:Transcript_7578/g.5730  ORF Transcript_7578/g.5730 Transcript_7578/m.5730 type:complete len:111 (-) Transcript_7578:295-627(-)